MVLNSTFVGRLIVVTFLPTSAASREHDSEKLKATMWLDSGRLNHHRWGSQTSRRKIWMSMVHPNVPSCHQSNMRCESTPALLPCPLCWVASCAGAFLSLSLCFFLCFSLSLSLFSPLFIMFFHCFFFCFFLFFLPRSPRIPSRFPHVLLLFSNCLSCCFLVL